METKQKTEIIYPITIGDLQNDAIKRIGRELAENWQMMSCVLPKNALNLGCHA